MNGYALVGLVTMIGSQVATLARIEPFWSWNTPIAWTGFILFADGSVWRARGNSWIRSAPREFAWLAIASICLWLVFELYNLSIENWHYVGLPDNRLLRSVGYAWSFATIWPAIFEGAELVAVWRGVHLGPEDDGGSTDRRETRTGVQRDMSPAMWLAIVIGVAMLVWPIVWPSRYLAAPVWLGFIFLLDPINARLGGESLIVDLRAGRLDRVKNLLLSGCLCGGLWEFWNYWSRAKWHYTVPIMEHVKLFEMPLAGYLGFPVFAIECFTMYVFVRLAFVRLTTDPATGDGATTSHVASSSRGTTLGRTIAL